MKRFLLASLVALAASVLWSENASAQSPSNLGFIPYGFYQPYGATYGSGIRTPPYFTTNPPVYYGSRHARPYGLSPFAAPPMVTAGQDYKSRLRSQFMQPVVPTPGPAPRVICNPCITHGCEADVKPVEQKQIKLGQVRTNPFVIDRIAKK